MMRRLSARSQIVPKRSGIPYGRRTFKVAILEKLDIASEEFVREFGKQFGRTLGRSPLWVTVIVAIAGFAGRIGHLLNALWSAWPL